MVDGARGSVPDRRWWITTVWSTWHRAHLPQGY